MSLHQILAKLGPKDRKFEVKARLSGALAVTLNLVRNHANYFKTLQPALYVLKIYANNAVNASQVPRHSCFLDDVRHAWILQQF